MHTGRRARSNQELEQKLVKYRQWARTYGGYHPVSTIPKQIRTVRRLGEAVDVMHPGKVLGDILEILTRDADRGIKAITLNHEIYDFEAWSRFLGEPVSIPRFKESRPAEPWVPTDEEVNRIRETALRNPDRSTGSRNRCMIDLLFAGGMRIGELIKINLKDFDQNFLTIASEKLEAPRVIGLPETVASRLREYIERYRCPTDRQALFTTRIGRMNYQYARYMIKSLAMKAGVPKFHAHAARHWCATTLLKRDSHGNRLDIREVQIHLGHANLSSTERYTHIKEKDVAEVASKHMERLLQQKSKS